MNTTTYLSPDPSKSRSFLRFQYHTQEQSKSAWKNKFVKFVEGLEWHWFVTIPVGGCPDDDEVRRRLRIIEAILCKKYVASHRYHKLPDFERFMMAVGFEGERQCGTRHAHFLIRVPQPKKKCSQLMLKSLLPLEFRFLWSVLSNGATPFLPFNLKKTAGLEFGQANTARKIYTVKNVQKGEVDWSRFEFVTPPKYRHFENENLSVIRNRDRQKRKALCLM
jgi:hypothetical protein